MNEYSSIAIGMVSLALLFVFIAGTVKRIQERNRKARILNQARYYQQAMMSGHFEMGEGENGLLYMLDDLQPDSDFAVRELYREHRKEKIN